MPRGSSCGMPTSLLLPPLPGATAADFTGFSRSTAKARCWVAARGLKRRAVALDEHFRHGRVRTCRTGWVRGSGGPGSGKIGYRPPRSCTT
eukprot:scaffold553_cov238-Pinguiococcus_pyrenoidosus.AAC.5